MKNSTIMNLHCSACSDSISLHIETEHPAYGQTGGWVNGALIEAATMLGWRHDITPESYSPDPGIAPVPAVDRIVCPFHADKMVCVRCLGVGPDDCSCMGRRKFDARRP